jgi:predicted ATP-grasp superfamily ATP-dependent carboligase
LVGDEGFGASGYKYCGNIATDVDVHWGGGSLVLRTATRLTRVIAREFGLVGVNSIDFILARGYPRVIEVNPRWSASLELAEWAYGVPVFDVHARACIDGRLPRFDLSSARRRRGATGKAIVFARRELVIGDTSSWLAPDRQGRHLIRDIPQPGERVQAGHPICTVFAQASNGAACYRQLRRRANTIYRATEPWIAP